MVVLSKGDYIWLPPKDKDEFSVEIGARVLNVRDGNVEVEDDNKKRLTVPMNDQIKLMHKSVVDGTADMIDLGDLNEAGMLRNLLIRYQSKEIYTYIGSILIAINPYQDLPIYANDYILKYKGKALNERPPHIYAIADNSYREMKSFDRDQTLTISGESGSGKTETTKFVLKFLAYASGQHSWIEQQILDANPILEAFGNAKTVRNDNSSRFGKYIDITFDKSGKILKADILQYLLEKSRIVGQNKGERNYHIFYAMLAGLGVKEKEDMDLRANTTYNYLQKDSMVVDGRNEVAEWNTVMAAFKVMQITDNNITSMLELLAAFLHLGQVDYTGRQDSLAVKDKGPVKSASRIMKVDEAKMIKALTHKTLKVANQTIATSLDKAGAQDVRDTFVKSVYGRMFEWLVAAINNTISKPTSVKEVLRYGILDIFGFENIGINSFEQLCINFTNERLQQFFIHHVFKLEQHEYDQEGINWSKIKFVDNQEIIDFVANQKLNVFALMDEETIFPKGTDESFTQKLLTIHSKSKLIGKGKGPPNSSFTINHFAGSITYSSKYFLEKNRDTFSIDFRELLQNSTNDFIQTIYGEELHQDITSKRRTLGSQFKTSMEHLMLLMSERHPFFVRCIKPNENKSANEFDRLLIAKQLRYSGMMETIRIRKVGYPIRHKYDDFVSRYFLILKSRSHIPAQADKVALTRQICGRVLKKDDFQIGKTKLFIKDQANAELEQERHAVLSEGIIGIQAIIRNWASNRIFLRTREAAALVQNFYRNSTEQRMYAKMRRGFMRLQSMMHSELVSKRYDKMVQNMGPLQAASRMYLVEKYNLQKMQQILELQAAAKSYMALRQLNRILSQRNDFKDAEKTRADLERKLARTIGASKASGEAAKKFETRQQEIKESHQALVKYEEIQQQLKKEQVKAYHLKKHQLPSEQDIIDRAFQHVFEPDSESKQQEDLELELAEYRYQNFAIKFYQNKQENASNKKQMLAMPLLKQENKLYDMAALSCWLMLLRFMGDISTKRIKSRLKDSSIPEFLGHNIVPLLLVDDQDTMNQSVEKHASYSLDPKGLKEAAFIPKSETTPFESMQYIIGMGILLRELRDEIYAQILKQLTGNDSIASAARGWILLAMTTGFFPPSDEVIKYLKAFIRTGPDAYSRYASYRLERTLKNGCRKQPPSFMECQTFKNRRLQEITVTLMDDSVCSIFVDSTTLGNEAVGAVCSKKKIEDPIGFGIIVCAFAAIEPVFDTDHLFDAVTTAESHTVKDGVPFKKLPLRFILKKIFFPPWPLSLSDTYATHLVYKQLLRGLKYGEYRCADETELAQYAVQAYYLNVGPKLTTGNLETFMQQIVNEFDLNNKRENYNFIQAFQQKFQEIIPDLKTTYGDTTEGHDALKLSLVESMRYRWPNKFLRHYFNVDISGPTVSNDNVDMYLTWKGIHFLNKTQILYSFHYPEIVDVSTVGPHETKRVKRSFQISTPLNKFVFSAMYADDIRTTLVRFMEGLKARSNYAMAIKDFEPETRGKGSLRLHRGDLIYLYKDGKEEGRTMLDGENDRNGKEGSFPADHVYIIPTGDKPALEAMETISKLAFKDISQFLFSGQLDSSVFPMWEKYAMRNIGRMTRRGKSILGKDIKRITYQKDLLHYPLLQKILTDDKTDIPLEALAETAMGCFKQILAYGRLPVKGFKRRDCQSIIDSLFQACLIGDDKSRHVYLLREEIYCQIMKQMTQCLNEDTLNRMWELMWLATGLFSPRKELADMLLFYFHSRDQKLANSCAARLQKVQKFGERRMPPTMIEIDTIQRKAYRMFHQIKLPDDSTQVVEIECLTTGENIAEKLAQKLGINNEDEFALLIRTKKYTISVPDKALFFDFIRHMSDKTFREIGYKDIEDNRFAYELVYVRKLWININPGDDIKADILFHFPQETQKYLRGFYSVTPDTAVQLAALIYRARNGEDTARFATLTREIQEYVPNDMIKMFDPDAWMSKITDRFVDNESMSRDGAKIETLMILASMPQFGMTYTLVKQTGNSSIPPRVIIGIGRKGVYLIDPQTKEHLVHAPYTKNLEWRSSKGILRLTLKPDLTIVCETPQDNKLENLLKSYKERLEEEEEPVVEEVNPNVAGTNTEYQSMNEGYDRLDYATLDNVSTSPHPPVPTTGGRQMRAGNARDSMYDEGRPSLSMMDKRLQELRNQLNAPLRDTMSTVSEDENEPAYNERYSVQMNPSPPPPPNSPPPPPPASTRLAPVQKQSSSNDDEGGMEF